MYKSNIELMFCTKAKPINSTLGRNKFQNIKRKKRLKETRPHVKTIFRFKALKKSFKKNHAFTVLIPLTKLLSFTILRPDLN